MRRIKIDPKLIDPNEATMLEDLIVAAVNDARAKAEQHEAGRDGQAHRRPPAPAGLQAAVLIPRSRRDDEE